MSRVLRNILVYFQAFPSAAGNSARHTRDMDHPVSIENIIKAAERERPPDVVAALATIGKDIADRLLRDERMDVVWRELRRWQPRACVVEKLAPELRLSTYGISDEVSHRRTRRSRRYSPSPR